MDFEYEPWNPPTAVELSNELVARVDALTERLRLTGLGQQLRLNRDLVLRIALLHGIEELERSSVS